MTHAEETCRLLETFSNERDQNCVVWLFESFCILFGASFW